eukprot:scpid14244/ scgid0969/ C-myc promoter-binding protein; DENN domain-containing protein 4A
MSSDPSIQRNQVADYFVLVGLGDSIRRYNAETQLAENAIDGSAASRASSSDSSEDTELRQLELPSVLDPITDIGVVFMAVGEQIPPEFCCISATPTGLCANFNHATANSPKAVYLCYRRGKDRPPLTDVDVVYKGVAPYQFDVIVRSVQGKHNADINHSSAGPPTNICYRRASAHSGRHFYGMAVTDLCVINSSKGEQVPRGFTRIDRAIRAGLTGPSFYLAYKKSLVKPHAVSYQAGILSRYPATDYPDFPLPESVPLFCLPLGASVESWSQETDYPLPTFSSFVLTHTTGNKVYGAAVSFYEDVSDHGSIEQMKKALFGEDEPQSARIYCSKSICILSHFPHFAAFKAFLSSLYRISISGETDIPLERYISNFMSDVPFPSPKRPTVLMQLGNESIVLSQPVKTPLPMSGATHAVLLHALSPENLITLLCLTLLEHKIILHSVKPSLLTAFGEALCSILFPVSWQCPYIPLCPLSLASFIHAPIPFMIGIDSRFFDLYDTPDDVCCINLDNNTIAHSPTSKKLPSSLLPKKPAAVLLKALRALQVQIPLGIDLDSDLAVTVAPLRVNPDQEDTASSDVAVREAFLRFHAQTLSGYSSFLRPLVKAPSEVSTDVSQLFDLKGFQRSHPQQEHDFFSKFFDTQMFNKFIEERSFVSDIDNALVFFDECTEIAERPEPLITVRTEGESHMTVVVSPPDMGNLPRKTFAYPSFSLDTTLFGERDTVQPTPEVPKSAALALVTCRRSRQEKSKSSRTAHRYIVDPRRWSKYLLAHTYAVWYAYLPAYVHSHTFKREAVQTAFKLLEAMHNSGIHAPDEVSYRILMEVCGAHGYPALAVRVLMEMRRMNLSPNAVTYARYNKVALESKWPSTSGYWRTIRNAINAIAQLNIRLRERRAILASSSALALADKGRIATIRKSMRVRGTTKPRNPETASVQSFTSAEDGGVGEGGGDADSLCSMSSYQQQAMGSVDQFPRNSESSTDDRSIVSRDEMPTIVYSSASAGITAHHWSTDNLATATTTVAKASPKRGHRRVASATIRTNGDLATCAGVTPPLSGSLTSMPGLSPRLGMHRRTPSNGSDNTANNVSHVVVALKEELDHSAHSVIATMASCTRCHHCECLVFDEQIMAGWQADDSDFNTNCPYCSKHFIAFLSITIELNSVYLTTPQQVPLSEDELEERFRRVRRIDLSPTATSGATTLYLCSLPEISVPYLSPLLLRKEVETLLDQDSSILSKSVLVDQHPIIYWNLLWYFDRLGLPSFLTNLLLDSELPKSHLVQVGDVSLSTSWHKEDMEETPVALYKQWLHRGSSAPSPVHPATNDAIAGQLQSLTARLQCAEYAACVTALLKERIAWKRAKSSSQQIPHGPEDFRGLYWDILLLLMTVSPATIDIVKFDREFARVLQRLPRDLTGELRRDDHPVGSNAGFFRRSFKLIGMSHW